MKVSFGVFHTKLFVCTVCLFSINMAKNVNRNHFDIFNELAKRDNKFISPLETKQNKWKFYFTGEMLYYIIIAF